MGRNLEIEAPTGELKELASSLADSYGGEFIISDASERFCQRVKPTLVARRAFMDDFGRPIYTLVVVDPELSPPNIGVASWVNKKTRLFHGVGQGAINGFEAELQQSLTVRLGVEHDQWTPQLLTQQPMVEMMTGEVQDGR